MNRIEKLLNPATPEAVRHAYGEGLQTGFRNGREYEREQMRTEWCGDVATAYQAGVEDGTRHERAVNRCDAWRALLSGMCCGAVLAAFWSYVAWRAWQW